MQTSRIAGLAFATILLSVSGFAATHTIPSGNVVALTNALISGANGDVIRLEAGTYDLSVITPTNITSGARTYLYVLSGRRYRIEGAGSKHWSAKTRDEETILRGGDDAAIFYMIDGNSRKSSFYGLTFENGAYKKFDGLKSEYGGGAVSLGRTDQSVPASGWNMVSNCVFRNCTSETDGGATYYVNAFDCFYTNCTATADGGGAFGGCRSNKDNDGKTNVFERCVFVDCHAKTTGGGLHCKVAPKALNDLTFVGCDAKTGGGLSCAEGDLSRVSGCVFSNCTASATSGNGGGMMVEGAIESISGCRFLDNVSNGSGAAMTVSGGFGMVENCTFADNRAETVGAGVHSEQYGGTVRNCTFADNYSGTKPSGDHVRNVFLVEGCTFRGHGGVLAQNYDRCTFENCEGITGKSNSDGLVVYDDTMPSDGYMRNCLFKGCTGRILVNNKSGRVLNVENCTFVTNVLGDASTTGFLFYAFRGRSIPDESGDLYPSTNLISNCIFHGNVIDGVRNDVKFLRTNTSVPQRAANIVSNSLYEVASFNHEPIVKSNFKQTTRINFVAGDEQFPNAPYYSVKRSSAAHKAGLLLGWMTDEARDLEGNPRVKDGAVDIGCYTCMLPPPGCVLIFR